jgi:hypothetical protein
MNILRFRVNTNVLLIGDRFVRKVTEPQKFTGAVEAETGTNRKLTPGNAEGLT